MKDESDFGKLSVVLMTMASLAVSVLYLFPSASALAIAPQGKGGEVVAKPSPTPKKTTPRRTRPARTTKNSKTNQPAKSASEATSAAEMIFWNSIKDSANPEDFNEYLKKYPNGEFAGLARNRLNALETAAKEEAARAEDARKAEARRKELELLKRPGAVVKNSIGMELVYIPAGDFIMGAPDSEHLRAMNETPQHQVTVQGFFMGKYEVTQAHWQRVLGTNPSFHKGDKLPVGNVSWNDAQAFIDKLNAMNDGYMYRLPTEAEWEYAARARTTTPFAFGPGLSSAQANINGHAPYGGAPQGVDRERPSPVGSFSPNAYGLYDMHGNLDEWCQDWYHDSYNGAPTDGSAWESGGEQKDRIFRGGSYFGNGASARSAMRGYRPPDYRFEAIGFRVVAVARTQ